MKQQLLLIVAALGTQSLCSQITLSEANHIPTVGSSFTFYTEANPSVSIHQSGANASWDLSGLSGPTETVDYISLSNSMQASSFPNANLVESHTSGSMSYENYYSSSAGGLLLEGQYVPSTAKLVFTDPRDLLKFPMNYTDVHNETFAGTMENIMAGQTFDRSGSTEIVADAYGELELPYGTVKDVLRVRVVSNYSDKYMGSTIGTYTDTIMLWYNSHTKNWIASYSSLHAAGYPPSSSATYIDQADLVTGVTGFVENNSTTYFYPNPARDHISFNVKDGEVTQAEVYALDGTLLSKSDGWVAGEQRMDLSHLENGVYLLKFTSGTKNHVEKLVIGQGG